MAAPVSPSATAMPVVIVAGDGSGGEVETDVLTVATGAAAALAPALPAVAGKTNYLTHFTVDGLGATAASVITVTITGLRGGTITRHLSVPAGATTAIAPLSADFARGRPASAANTAVTLNVPSFGAGNTSAVAQIHGFTR